MKPIYGIRRPVRRLAFLLGGILILSACGKKVRVAVPSGSPVRAVSSTSELIGLASYYAEPYHGRKTANGETFDTYEELTAAHRTLAFNTVVKVTNESNGRDVEVRINDRGPFIDGRVIDLSLKAAREIDMVRAGIVPVKLDIVKRARPRRAAPLNPQERLPLLRPPCSQFRSELLKHRTRPKACSASSRSVTAMLPSKRCPRRARFFVFESEGLLILRQPRSFPNSFAKSPSILLSFA